MSARTDRAFERAASLFRHLTDKIVRVAPEEAELAKLFTNSYRYIKFAAANQLFMMANDFGLDYERIRSAVIEDYPRAADLPGPGFAAGPCLLEGHHAAGGLQQQQLRPRSGQHADQRGPSPVSGRLEWPLATT